MTRAEHAAAKAQREVDAWNAKNPVGSRVRYWTFVKRGDPTGETNTFEPAYVALSGTPMVAVRRPYQDGHVERDSIALTHVEVVLG